MQIQGKFKEVRKVTLLTLSLKDTGTAVQVKISTPIREGRKLEGQKDREPAFICHVVDLADGEEKQMIAPKVLRSTLEEEYPDDQYVNKFFYIENLGKKAGKGKSAEGYNTFKIIEIAPVENAKAK